MKYNSSGSSNTWSKSTLKKWLNGTGKDENGGDQFFTDSNFKTEEKNRILSVDIKDYAGQTKNSSEIIDTSGKDKIFLLSSADAGMYFENNDDRKAKYNGAETNWWLRSPILSSNTSTGFHATNLIFVQDSGGFSAQGYPGGNHSLGVRPALWLDFSSTEIKNAAMTISFTKETESPNDDDPETPETPQNPENPDKPKSHETNPIDIPDKPNNSVTNDTTTPQAPETETDVEISPINENNENDELPEKVENNEEVISNDLKNMSKDDLKEKFENTSNIVLSGDLSNSNSEEVANFIKKIEEVTDIKTLDLSNVTGLTEVALPEGNKIEELNIANSATLTKLDVSNSPIKKLNTSGCSKLESLNCESCDIVELNIEGCEELLELNCSYNCLTRLDISELKNLSSLKCDHQSIDGVKIVENFNFIDFLFRTNSEILATSDSFTDELEKVKNLKAFNENNEAISVNLDENTGKITFSEEPAIIKYNYETGFKNVLMDVTIKTTTIDIEDTESEEKNNGSGGCISNGEFLSFLAALYVILLKNLKPIRLTQTHNNFL